MAAFITALVLASIMIYIFSDSSKTNKKSRKPRNTSWKPCTYCHTCKKHFSQADLDPSVYTCPSCGKETDIRYSYRYVNDTLEIQNAITGKPVD